MGDIASTFFKIILGIILILLPLYLVIFQWPSTLGTATLMFIEGGIIVFIILIGVALTIVGLSDLS